MFLIDVPNFVEDVPGVLPVQNQDVLASLFRAACDFFGNANHARCWIHACEECDLQVLRTCLDAAAG